MKKLECINVKELVEDYIKNKIWQSKENSNQRYSYSSVSWRLSGEFMTRYVLSQVYPKEISKAHLNGDFHIHNLYMGITGYCCGWSIEDILRKGVGIDEQVSCKPAKHFDSALNQIANFLGVVSNEWSGAQALNSFDIFLAPFVRKDKLSYKQVKQTMQGFIYTLNLPLRWGGQTPFTNITFDLIVPEDLKEKNIIIGGVEQKEKYKNFQKEINLINKAFIEIMIEGNSHSRVLSFPIPTYNITKDFDWDSDIVSLLFEMTAKYGIPYFQNFINSDLDPHSIRAMCCHLRLDLNELKNKRVGGFFGYADKTGSVGVVTINMPKIGYLSKTEKQFFNKLNYLLDLAKDSLQIKRFVVSNYIKNNLFPYTKKYLGSLNYHFSTIGIIGMNECCLNFLNKNIASKDGKAFTEKVLNFIRKRLIEYQKETNTIFNLEATPAESCGYRLAQIDKKKYKNIKTAGKKEYYYTNSSILPVDYTADISEALEHQNDLQILYNGGTVFHSFLPERITALQAKKLIKNILKNYKLPYVTLTPTFSICVDHGYLNGEQFICPKCKKSCQVYSRVVGFLTPVQNWNKGKQEEFKDRSEYKITRVR